MIVVVVVGIVVVVVFMSGLHPDIDLVEKVAVPHISHDERYKMIDQVSI